MAERAGRRAPLSSATQRQARPARPPVPRWDPAGAPPYRQPLSLFCKIPKPRTPRPRPLSPYRAGRPRPSRLLGSVASRAPDKNKKPNSAKGKSDIALVNAGQAKKPFGGRHGSHRGRPGPDSDQELVPADGHEDPRRAPNRSGPADASRSGAPEACGS